MKHVLYLLTKELIADQKVIAASHELSKKGRISEHNHDLVCERMLPKIEELNKAIELITKYEREN